MRKDLIITRTIKQTQPFAHCTPNEATSRYMFEDTDLYGDGLYGAHGGSGLSAVGGALRCGELALPVWMDLDSLGLETKPARILAEAFQNFGAYLVDDTAWDVYAIVTEWSPEGRFAEEFEKNWGFPINDSNKNTPWNRDMDKIYLNLHVVVNNGPDTAGGGGTPLMPLAPPFESH